MKSTVALTLLATIALHQVAYAQEEVNIATAPAVPTLPAAVTDIYWWKTLLTGDEISNYLTGPATEAATATQATTDAQETNSADTTTAAVTEATPTGQESLSAAATATDSAISSVNSNLASAISDASSAISDILSTSAAVSDSIATSSGGKIRIYNLLRPSPFNTNTFLLFFFCPLYSSTFSFCRCLDKFFCFLCSTYSCC